MSDCSTCAVWRTIAAVALTFIGTLFLFAKVMTAERRLACRSLTSDSAFARNTPWHSAHVQALCANHIEAAEALSK